MVVACTEIEGAPVIAPAGEENVNAQPQADSAAVAPKATRKKNADAKPKRGRPKGSRKSIYLHIPTPCLHLYFISAGVTPSYTYCMSY